jgi:hypothetical protein
MIVALESQGLQTLEQVRAFLEGPHPLDFEAQVREAPYHWIGTELHRLRYTGLGKADGGLVRRYVERTTGLSRAQLFRSINNDQDPAA